MNEKYEIVRFVDGDFELDVKGISIMRPYGSK